MFKAENYSVEAQAVAERALALSERLKHTQIDVEHLLLAMIEQKGGIVPQILSRMNVDAGTLRLSLSDDLRKSPRVDAVRGGAGKVFVTQHVSPVFKAAAGYAGTLGDAWVGPEHLFLAILDAAKTPSGRILKKAGLTSKKVLETIRAIRAQARPQRPDSGPFSRFTEPARVTAANALAIAQRYKHTVVDVEHMMLALLEQREGIVVQLLEIAMVNLKDFWDFLDHNLKSSRRTTPAAPKEGQVFMTQRTNDVLDHAQREAGDLGDKQISTEHLLLGILAEDGSAAAGYLKKAGLTQDIVVEVRDLIRANTRGGSPHLN